MHTITLDDIRAQLAIPSRFHGGTGLHALPLLEAIAAEPDLAAPLQKWLSEGGTVFLRDTLADRFKENIQTLCPDLSTDICAFSNAWMPIDTAWLHCAVRTGQRPPYFDDLPRAPYTASLLFDPFRLWPAWLCLTFENNIVKRERFETRAIALRTLSAQGHVVQID